MIKNCYFFFQFSDPKEIDAPLLKQPLHFMPDKSQAPAWMSETSEKLKNTSGFVIVCPEYNCTIPPALTNLLDYFPPPIFRHKPVSLVTYSMGTYACILNCKQTADMHSKTLQTLATTAMIDFN